MSLMLDFVLLYIVDSYLYVNVFNSIVLYNHTISHLYLLTSLFFLQLFQLFLRQLTNETI